MSGTSRSQRIRAIVLRHTNYGEADRFLTLLSAEEGKISALVRGVRKMNSRKAGHLQPFSYVSIQLSKGRGPNWEIDQAAIIESYSAISESMEKTVMASYVMELADRFSYEEEPNLNLFQLVLDSLRRIDHLADIYPVIRYYEIHLLEIVGYRPQLNECVCCRKEIKPENQFFSTRMGGVLCPNCGGRDPVSHPISMRALKFLRYYQMYDFRRAASAGWPNDLRFESEMLINEFYTYILERKINSLEFNKAIISYPLGENSPSRCRDGQGLQG